MLKRLAILGGLVILAFFLFSLAGLFFQGHALGLRAGAIQAEIDTLRAQNERLKAESARLQTDAALEGLARAQLGYVKDGETAVVVDFGPAGPPRPSPTRTPTPVPNWQQWVSILVGP